MPGPVGIKGPDVSKAPLCCFLQVSCHFVCLTQGKKGLSGEVGPDGLDGAQGPEGPQVRLGRWDFPPV